MKKIIVFVMFLYAILNAQNLQTDRTLVEGVLENGLKYTIKKNEKPAQMASFRLVVNVGSLEEDEDQRGIAHLVEHLAFNGSKHFKGNSLVNFLESLGVNFGSHLNASTGTTSTIYQLQVPLKSDNLKNAMLVFADWAGGLVFTQKELDKERGVVLEEERARNTVGYRIYKQIYKFMYANSRFENRLPIGLRSVIKNITLKRVKDFYDTWYQPRFMNFIAVGDFDVKSMEKLIKNSFKDLKNTNNNKLYSQTVHVPKDGSIRVFKDKEVIRMNTNLSFIGDYKPLKTEADYKDMFTKDLARILFNLKARELELSKNPAAKYMRFVFRNVGDNLMYYTFYAAFLGDDGLDAFSQMANLVHEVNQNGFNIKDYEIIKKDIISSNEESVRGLKSKSSNSYASEIAYKKADKEIYIDEKYRSKLEKDLLNIITIHDINEAFRKIVSKDKIAYLVVPDDYKVDEKQIQSRLKSSSKLTRVAKKSKSLPNDIAIKDLKSAKIVAENYNKKYDFYEYKLQNGVKIVYKFNDYEKGKVLLKAFSKGGYSIYDTALLPSAKKSTQIVENSGLGDYNFLEVEKIYADKIFEIEPFIDRYFEGFKGSSSSKDFKYLLKSIYLLSTNFKVDENVLFNEKAKMLEELDKKKNSPRLIFSDEFLNFYFNGNKRYTKLDKNDISSINKSSILSIYKDRFSDFNNFTFLIVGDVKKDEVEKYISIYFGNLPTQNRVESFKDRGVRHIKGKHDFIKNLNNENVSLVSLSYKNLTPYSKIENTRIILLGDVLETKLRELIREEKSGVYGVSVHSYFDRLPENESVVSIYFMCEPKRRVELVNYVKSTIDEIINKNVDEKYITTSIKKNLVYIDEKSKENAFWATILEKAFKYNEPILNANEYKDMYKQISADTLKQSAKSYLDTKDIIYSELNPISEK